MKNSNLFCAFLLFIYLSTASAQEGFVQIYDLGYPGTVFQGISLANDTVVCVGFGVDTTINKWDMMITKLDTNGVVLFRQLYHNADSNIVSMRKNTAIIKTSHGGYLTFGHAGPFLYLLNINANGTLRFLKRYQFNATFVEPKKIVEVEGGYLLVGERQLADFSVEIFVKKVDFDGNELWEKIHGFSSTRDIVNSFWKLDDNTFMMGHSQNARQGVPVFWSKAQITALDSLGDIKWEWSSTIEDKYYNLWGLNQTLDGGWMFICVYPEYYYEQSDDYRTKYRIVKLDKNRC